MSKRSAELQAWITQQGLDNGSFTAVDLAQSKGITTHEASEMIQAFHRRQTRVGDNAYVIWREGRTRGAVWHVGTRTRDASGLARQAYDDLQHRWVNETIPSLHCIGDLNPRAAAVVSVMEVAFEYNLGQLDKLLRTKQVPVVTGTPGK